MRGTMIYWKSWLSEWPKLDPGELESIIAFPLQIRRPTVFTYSVNRTAECVTEQTIVVVEHPSSTSRGLQGI